MQALPHPSAPGKSVLHILDQRGAHWMLDHNNTVTLQGSSVAASGSRSMAHTGAVAVDPIRFTFPSSHLLGSASLILKGTFLTTPWCPKETTAILYEDSPSGTYHPNNWSGRLSQWSLVDGFMAQRFGGCLINDGTNNEIWQWSAPVAPIGGSPTESWGNIVEALRIDSTNQFSGIWSSTRHRTSAGPSLFQTADKCDYLKLRSYVDFVESVTQQSTVAVALSTGAGQTSRAIVLGTPGGKVCVVQPGAWRTDDNTNHQLGTVSFSDDLGFGGTALAVQHDAPGGIGRLRIWFGTLQDPPPRPNGYGSLPGSALAEPELAAGAIHSLYWSQGQGFTKAHLPIRLSPTQQAPDGASAIVGMQLVSLESICSYQLVVCTLSGDIILYDAYTMTELWRTRIHGAAGFYNAIRAADLDGDGLTEIYVAGSAGLCRLHQPGE